MAHKIFSLDPVSKFLFSLVIALSSPLAYADIYSCNGTWTNKPCKDDSIKTLSERSRPASDANSEEKKRKSWLHDLDMLRLRAKSDYNIDVRIGAVEEICLRQKSSLLECSQMIDNKESEINKLIVAHKALDEASKNREKISAPTETPSIKISNTDNTIVIIKNEVKKGPIKAEPAPTPLKPIDMSKGASRKHSRVSVSKIN